MKDEMFFQTMLYQGDIQDVDVKEQNDSNVLDDIKAFLKACLMTGNIDTLWNMYNDYILSM